MAVSVDNDKKGLTRRQFLTYALGGTGAFMGVTILAPLVSFAVDPLTRSQGDVFTDTGKKADEISDKYPTKVEFKVKQKDGWIEGENTYTAFILKQKDGSFLAMSSICTHLGCQVNTNQGPDGNPAPFEGDIFFHCPCHGSKFTLNGIQTPGSPAQRPLDVFTTKVDGSGKLLIGSTKHSRTV